MKLDLLNLGVSELRAAYRARTLSPVAVARAHLSQIERLNPKFNAYHVVDSQGALEAAKRSEGRWEAASPCGPLDGITFGVKGLIQKAGIVRSMGSLALQATEIPTDDAPAVARLVEGGGIFLGTTTTSEFGWKGTADSPLTGLTRNGWAPELTSGGSSGGAAVAAALGMGTLHLGTDGGGSLRIPAAFNGVAGFKATFGRVPAWPAGPMLTLSNTGPIAQSVADVIELMDAISQPDARDWNSLEPTSSSLSKQVASTDLRGLRVGVVTRIGPLTADAEALEALDSAADIFRDQGLTVTRVGLPEVDYRQIFLNHWRVGAARLLSTIPQDRHVLIDEGLRADAEHGGLMPTSTYYDAVLRRQSLGEQMRLVMQKVDALLLPCVPFMPFEAGLEYPGNRGFASWVDWAAFTYVFNLTRQPAASVPMPRGSLRVPVSVQIASDIYRDALVLRLAQLLGNGGLGHDLRQLRVCRQEFC